MAPHEYLKKGIGVLSLDAKVALIGLNFEAKQVKQAEVDAEAQAKLKNMLRK